MTNTKDGGKAFPGGQKAAHDPHPPYYSGMSLRDYFAGQALVGMSFDYGHVDDLANDAFRIADAMIEAREK